MYDDDRRAPLSDIPDSPDELELRLAEMEWEPQPAREIDPEELENALAVLAALGLEDEDMDYDANGDLPPRWLH